MKGIIYSAKVDKEGAWMLTLSIPKSDGSKVAALTMYTETSFDIAFNVDPASGEERLNRL